MPFEPCKKLRLNCRSKLQKEDFKGRKGDGAIGGLLFCAFVSRSSFSTVNEF
jgi:hypothetical protein